MSEAEESQGAKTLPSTAQPLQVSPNAETFFYRVNVLLEPYDKNKKHSQNFWIERVEDFWFEATVRLETDCMTITYKRDTEDIGEISRMWCYGFVYFKSIDIQETLVVIKTVECKITLEFRIELPSNKNDTKRFAQQINILFPKHIPLDIVYR